MRQYIYYKNSGEIAQVVRYADLITPEHPEDLNVLEIDRDLDDVVNKYYDIEAGELKDKAPIPSGSYDYWEWQPNNTWSFKPEVFIEDIRVQRTTKLYDSDWTQAVDSPLSDEKKAEWRTYRQSLRDIVSNLPADLDDPGNVVWPTEPS